MTFVSQDTTADSDELSTSIQHFSANFKQEKNTIVKIKEPLEERAGWKNTEEDLKSGLGCVLKDEEAFYL